MSHQLLSRVLIPSASAGIVILIATALLVPEHSSATLVLLILAGAIAILIGATLWALQSLVISRLNTIERYLELVADDKRAPSDPLTDNSRDELGRISRTLSDFVENLREVLSNIRGDARIILDDATGQSERMTLAVRQLQNNSGEAEKIAETIDQIAHASTSLADNAGQIADSLNDAIRSMELGREASSANRAAMRELAGNVTNMSENIARLQEESAQIGSVLDVIGGIAEQTNLLALNAAIEAARAGDQGRGFAVVADEVRALAHRTQDSTGEIQKMVEGLQEKAHSAVSAMEQGKQLSQKSLEQSQQVKEVLDQVQDVVANINALAREIAQGISSQTDATSSINTRMAEIARQVKDVSADLGIISEKALDQQDMAHHVEGQLNRICV